VRVLASDNGRAARPLLKIRYLTTALPEHAGGYGVPPCRYLPNPAPGGEVACGLPVGAGRWTAYVTQSWSSQGPPQGLNPDLGKEQLEADVVDPPGRCWPMGQVGHPPQAQRLPGRQGERWRSAARPDPANAAAASRLAAFAQSGVPT